MDNVQQADHCAPDTPAPQPQEDPQMCEGTFRMECCCPRLYTRTFILNIGPQTEASLQAYLQNTVNNYEQNGYLILAHSVTDTGAGWGFDLTIGWYA